MGDKGEPKAPDGLGVQAASVWSDIVGRYELRRDELRTLEDMCRTLDLVERMEAELSAGALIVEGSQRQPVANPIAGEIRQHRGLLLRQMAALHLPEEEAADGGVSISRSEHGRNLAGQRWKRAG